MRQHSVAFFLQRGDDYEIGCIGLYFGILIVRRSLGLCRGLRLFFTILWKIFYVHTITNKIFFNFPYLCLCFFDLSINKRGCIYAHLVFPLEFNT
ncbi:hypothetical protein SE17_24125 [Kouleothrix aurantiaca]|uniref:Uncharacterized protein n=1 Tax=Kouleothrix aurantiaca TaxID=186479 RepID=A0A0N8PRU8_9CHLR|nr:hypothetical protein SE17_24125 [Kouleothrix aurantiaca]